MDMNGKIALVTGGAKRVGRVIALKLAERGANVVISYRTSRQAALATVRDLKKYGVKAAAVRADVSSVKQSQALVRGTVKRFGLLDILINNAAVFYRTPFESVSEKDWDRHMDINLKGAFFCAREAGLFMLKRGTGKIINIADWAGMRPYRHYLPYCISKAGVICMTMALAKTLAPKIQVNAIAPGPVLLPDDFSAEERKKIIRGTPLGRVGSPEDIANTVLFLIEGSDFITGTTVCVDGGRAIA